MKSDLSKNEFRKILSSTRSNSRISNSAAFDSVRGLEKAILSESFESISASANNNEEHSWQMEIRPQFNKSEINKEKIGGHPDFNHLGGTEAIEFHHTCTLFLDIKNSTRLAFIYDLKDVIWIKNSILKAASEMVRSLDGHVHRFMGDALLAFFGRKGEKPEDSIINAINCTSVLEAMMVRTIIPVLVEEGYDARDLGFRIGLDYGPKEKVAWSSYGFNEVREVTATSFHVDVASKLQNMARKNNCMLGESIINAIDFPSEFIRKKIEIRGESRIEVDTLNRTYTDKSGATIKYKVRELNKEAYRDILPFPASEKSLFDDSKCIGNDAISFKCYATENGSLNEYKSVSRALEKGVQLKFKLNIQRSIFKTIDFPLRVTFTKRNYGTQAQLNNSAGIFPLGTHDITLQRELNNSLFFSGKTIEQSEHTQYRGLHTMEATVKNRSGETIFKDTIGVFII